MASTFNERLINAIQKCYDLHSTNDNLITLCEELNLQLLKVSESKYGFISEMINSENECIVPHFNFLTNIDSLKLKFNIDVVKLNKYVNYNKKLIIPDAVELNSIENTSIKSLVYIPMIFKNKHIGVIVMINRNNGYTEEFIELLNPLINTIVHIIGSSIKIRKIDFSKIKNNNNLNQTKDNFLAKITHDIRTPIGAIIGILTLLKKKTTLDEKQIQYVNMINNCSDQLLCLINDILNFSKCKNGKMKVQNKPMNLKECLEKVCDMNYAKANEKKLNISYIIDKNVPLYIISDNNKIKQILVNLISNAIKFTNKGSIVIYVHVDKKESKKQFCDKVIINFSVYDTGIGIPKNCIYKIFDSFEQIENLYNRNVIGTGLGLSICKDFTNLLGGDIGVNSTEGKGSEFYFNITASCIDLNNNDCLKDKHIMVIDDEIINRMLYNNIFTEMGMKTHMFSSGEKSLDYIRNNNINIAFIDIHMPGTDGIELANKINKINNNIILISISADISLKNADWISTEKNVFEKNIYTPVNKEILSKILIDLLINVDKPIKKQNSERYRSPKKCEMNSLWFGKYCTLD